MSDAALDLHEALIAGLMQPAAYPHAVAQVERIDTHISTVLLAGDYAYKLKKPVAFDFVDFSTVERRRQSCVDEVRLNQRTAPRIYVDVVPIAGPRSAPRIGGSGTVVEYAVRMRRFDSAQTLDRLARDGAISAAHIDRLAATIARFHADANRAVGSAGPDSVRQRVDDNFAFMRERVQSAADRARLDALAAWSAAGLRAHSARIAARSAQGFVREGHGDLHLGNIVMLDGEPVPFDALEFNAGLRRIDVINDIAFTFMDLLDHGLPGPAWRLVGAYVEHTGDYEGLALLHFYAGYRALVRAKIALIREQQSHVARHLRLHEHRSFASYLALAEQLAAPRARRLVVMCGLSGSGKSTVAQHLAETMPAIRVRSDVERKRLHGLAATARSDGRIYGEAATRATYARLADIARSLLEADLAAIIDAAFLQRDERRAFRALAEELGARFTLLVCEAPVEVLRARVAARAAQGGDPSEADVDVLQRQLAWWQPLAADELADVVRCDTSSGAWAQALAGLVERGHALPAANPTHRLSNG